MNQMNKQKVLSIVNLSMIHFFVCARALAYHMSWSKTSMAISLVRLGLWGNLKELL